MVNGVLDGVADPKFFVRCNKAFPFHSIPFKPGNLQRNQHFRKASYRETSQLIKLPLKVEVNFETATDCSVTF